MMSMPEDLARENNLAIIGDEEIVHGFKALGFKVYPIKTLNQTPEDYKKIFAEIINNKTVVCLVQDSIYKLTQETINSYRQLPFSVFIPFSKQEPISLLDKMIKDIKLRAIGTL